MAIVILLMLTFSQRWPVGAPSHFHRCVIQPRLLVAPLLSGIAGCPNTVSLGKRIFVLKHTHTHTLGRINTKDTVGNPLYPYQANCIVLAIFSWLPLPILRKESCS